MLWAAWPPLPFTVLVFAGFVPLLIAEKMISESFTSYTGLRVWISLYLGLLVWNLLTTWWVSNASLLGGIFANMANPILMTVPFMLARYTRKQFGNRIGYVSLLFYWMSFEFIHLRWELTWPWLSLGNVFALQHTWIQWYEYTGVFGGTLWIWICNFLIFFILYDRIFAEGKNTGMHTSLFNKYLPHISLLMIITIPILLSELMYNNYSEKGKPVNVTVLQPNFDAFTEKFTIPYRVQMEKMQRLSKEKLTDSTDFLVWPETSIQTDIWLDRIKYEKPLRDLDKFIDSFPDLTMVIGINGYQRYRDREEASATARELIYNQLKPGGPDTLIYDIFNTALQLDSSRIYHYYHKSKLVPGVERMPYPGFFSFISNWAIDLGGITGSLGIQKDRTVFFNKDSVGVAPVICYESIFGEYTTDYINGGANLIFIITNDGWWGNTAGYRQHCLYAKLRSIETRRSIARSANTGISCFINQRGDISQARGWREDAVINATLPANDTLTFYVRHGDYLARIACVSAAILLLLSIINHRLYKFKKVTY